MRVVEFGRLFLVVLLGFFYVALGYAGEKLMGSENERGIAGLSSGVFPKAVVNWCEFDWREKNGHKFLVGHSQVVVELKNKENEVEEKAYIYLECKGNLKVNGPGRRLGPLSVSTRCLGVRMRISADETLEHYSINLIDPDEIELLSRPGTSPIKLAWQAPGSTFEIVNGENFKWTLNSDLSGRTHVGSVSCKNKR